MEGARKLPDTTRTKTVGLADAGALGVSTRYSSARCLAANRRSALSAAEWSCLHRARVSVAHRSSRKF